MGKARSRLTGKHSQGLYPLKKFPATIGKETAGTVVALPTDKDVVNNATFIKRGYAVGGRVAAVRSVLSIAEFQALSPHDLKDFLGTHATYIAVPWRAVYPVPSSVPSRIAAAGLLQAITAVSFFEEAYNLQKGDVILVHTVAGGLGLLFAQLAKHRGATVIGTTSTPEKAEIAKANGADHVILYPVEDTVKRVLEITNGEGVHAVFDGVGKDT